MPSSRKPRPRPAESLWLGAAALLGLALVVYFRALGCGWLWDDDANVTACAPVLAWNGLATLWLDPRAIQQYYPVLHTTFWVEHKLWGLEPLGYHAVNVLLHALNGLLLWRVLRRLGLPAAAAWISGALFDVHPVHVESVAWVTEMKNTLSFAFYLGSARLWIDWARLVEADGEEAGSHRKLAGSLLLFVLALLSKSVTMTLPLALLAVAWWKRGRWSRREWSVIPFLAASIGFGLLTIHLESENVGTAYLDLPLTLAQRVLLAGRALWFYAAKLAFPIHLNFVYPRWSLDPTAIGPWLFPLGAAVALASLFFLRHRIGRGPVTAACVWGATLAPMLGFFDIFFFRYSYASDHFLYHASAAPLAMAGLGLARVGAMLDRSWKRASTVLLAAVLSTLGGLSADRVRVFQDSTALWTDTLRRNPDAWIAWNNLGRITLDAGRTDEAESMLRRAIAIDDRQHEAWNNLGICLMSRERPAEALSAFQRAIALHPTGVSEHENLGRALLLCGDRAQAIVVLREVIAHPDHSAGAEVDLAEALIRDGRFAAAQDACRAARTRFPDDTRFHLLLAIVLRHQGGLGEAERVLEDAAARTGRSDPVVLDALATTIAASGRFEEAVRVEEEALALQAGPNAEAVLRSHLEAFRRSEQPR